MSGASTLEALIWSVPAAGTSMRAVSRLPLQAAPASVSLAPSRETSKKALPPPSQVMVRT